ncbi:exostosin domain-containing protein [Olleya marilimosa]|uniref:Exostosin family protein n=1 Tax=Olleya marilimosa TaxID=272164 RepID=A0ABR8LYN1_9FLAO|nr:exostosin family protein [Olleya marilimosa]MBD3863595.1 exostosin family protein [Olleya marilimosa]
MLKLYTNTNFLTETYRRQVFPLLFDLVFKQHQKLLEKYSIVSNVNDANIVVLPLDYAVFLKQREPFLALLKAANTAKLPIWIYTAGDYGFTNFIPNSYTFRLGGFDSKMDKNTYVLPSFINDPYASVLTQGFTVLKKTNTPNIGFVGHAQSGVLKYLKDYTNHLKYQFKRKCNKILADKQWFYPSSVKRANYLKRLAVNEDLETNFILRTKYRAGSQTIETQLETTQQFYDNLFNNAYTFCIRGVGNFSVRFYETLAVGRIPILLNTDCRLPLSNQIDWTKHCLIIDASSHITIADQILEYHNSLTASAFENIQRSNRNLWLNTLQRDAYFLEIYKQFKTKK